MFALGKPLPLRISGCETSCFRVFLIVTACKRFDNICDIAVLDQPSSVFRILHIAGLFIQHNASSLVCGLKRLFGSGQVCWFKFHWLFLSCFLLFLFLLLQFYFVILKRHYVKYAFSSLKR